MSEVLFSCMVNGEELQRVQKGHLTQFLCIAIDRENGSKNNAAIEKIIESRGKVGGFTNMRLKKGI